MTANEALDIIVDVFDDSPWAIVKAKDFIKFIDTAADAGDKRALEMRRHFTQVAVVFQKVSS